MELLATGAALATDRLRFLHRWSRKLEQADAAHSQLLRYADDLRTTFSAERRRAEELGEALDAVELAYTATVRALASAVEAKDAYTGGHLARVTAYGIEACRCLGGDLAATPGLEYAFLLHDLGKIGVPDAVLNKAGPLTDEEWALMREHPAIGLRILEGVPHMDVVRAVVYSHHERWDGAGYPEGLKDEQIPLAARVFAAVDAFDAITTDRPYRAAVSLEEALHRLREASGTQFAPDAVEAIHLVDRGGWRRSRRPRTAGASDAAPAGAGHRPRRPARAAGGGLGVGHLLAARDAARSNTWLPSTVERVDTLRSTTTALGRDFVTMEPSRRAYLLTGDEQAQDAHVAAEANAGEGFERVRELSRRWPGLPPLVEQVAGEYRAWVRTGHSELRAKQRYGAMSAALVAAGSNADHHFQALWNRQTDLEDQLARAQRAYARSQDRTYETAQTLAVRTALMMLGALILLAIWLRRAVGAPADALRSASGRLAGGDLETPVTLGVENELGAVASDLETMRRRLAGRMEALERLRHLSAQVVGATSLQRLAEVVLEGLRPEIGATRAVLGAARPGGELHLRTLAGFPDPAVADDIVKADAELRLVLPLPTLRAGQVVGMDDLDQVTAGFSVLRDLVARMGIASLALVPLLSRGRFLGLLALCWTERHQLDREQEALLGLAGNQIAGALEAALRLEEAERAAGEAQAVFYAIADGVLLTDPYGRVTAMNRALEALTGWTEAEAKGPALRRGPAAGHRPGGRPGRPGQPLRPPGAGGRLLGPHLRRPGPGRGRGRRDP